ncbi:tyrosine-protein phosphatase Lar-like [Strongylocentrotus purpuratus]|uniref:Fibronectin type-III domain-containing protein n=1 Tax=Strongylocentrotus purpuratus TaxID=7668 RepID=A0A7M7PJB5_STRPU|nr:tyrosine-protein phosphatase Lar-like [Strongylocentrotus purpuratus]XP_030852782.1 tyrosine-protein phosphatase Lar-like [Strongylocentrotus purpuratus]
MPVITELTPHQEDSGTTGLTVSWQPPSSPPCQPTYYEIKYYILQGDMCEDNSRDRIMTSAGTVNGSTFTFNVLELRPNSEYMVFVRGRTSSGYGDSDSQSAITGYSYPAGPPTNIQPTITRMRNIIFTWEKPECGYRNGPISSYEVMFFNSAGDVVYHGNVSGPPHEISDLISYSNYSISIRAWNYELAGVYSLPIWAQTNEARPASVEALQMSPSTTQIEVSWEPSSSPSSADYYIIRYSLYQKLACQSPETTPTEFEVNTNVTQYNNLVGLEPYSRYKITVTAVHGAGQSEPTIDYSDTRPGAPSNITNVRVNPERTSPTRIGFTWQPLNCRNVNGVFWYYHARIYKDGYRSYGMAGRAYLDDDFSHSSVEFNGLVACTMYELNIYACNHDDVSNTCGNLSHAIGVTGVTFTSASAYATGNQLRVTWSVPSQCNVDYYKLSYQLISRKACQDVPVIDAQVYELNVTSVSTDVTKYISNLEYYATYSISIIAVIRRAESVPMNVSGDTLAGGPTGYPTNIQSTSTNKRSIVFNWETPDCGNRNGPISSYEVMLSNSTGDVVYHGNVSASAEPEHEIFELIPSSNYSIRIRAWNYELAGEYGPAIWVQTD